jgi:hypothetical protein
MKILKFCAVVLAVSLLLALPAISSPSTDSASESPVLSPSPVVAQPSPNGAAEPETSADLQSPSESTDLEKRHPSGDAYQPTLRAKALELAGAFSNDGYKIRDSFWLSKLLPIGQTTILAVNLFAENKYWFCVAAGSPARRLVLKLYNEAGDLVSTQSYDRDSTAALGAEPSESGKYYLSVELLEGEPANFCVLYTYK